VCSPLDFLRTWSRAWSGWFLKFMVKTNLKIRQNQSQHPQLRVTVTFGLGLVRPELVVDWHQQVLLQAVPKPSSGGERFIKLATFCRQSPPSA